MRKFMTIVAGACLLAACHESLEDKAAREVKEITRKSCPQQLGNGMTYDSITFDRARKEIHYHYTIEGAADDAELLRPKQKEMREKMLESFRNDLSKKAYKEAGFSMGVTIYSKKNPRQILFDTRYTAEDLKD